MAWRGWNKNEYPYHNGVLNDKEALGIICRKFNEYLTYQDYNFTALTYYLKMLFENGKVYISESVKKQNAFHNAPIDYKNRGIKSNRWEHVVPIKVLISYALWLYQKHCVITTPPNLQAFADELNHLREKYGNICIVTKNEDKKLPRESMSTKMYCSKKIIKNRQIDVYDLSKYVPWDRYEGNISHVYELDSNTRNYTLVF